MVREDISAWPSRRYVGVVEDGALVRVYRWNDWIQLTYQQRPRDVVTIDDAEDEIDAYLKFHYGDYM